MNMKALYLNCFSGISGNMFIGALLDAGLPEADLREMVKKLPLGGYRLKIDRVDKGGISATHFDVELDQAAHQPHRHLEDIVGIIEGSGLSASVKKRSIAVFRRLAEAEGKVHGEPADHVHFHEVGAVDAIIDVVGTVFGLEKLGVEKVYADSITTGRGFVKCAHGNMPVPAPATAELLNGIPYRQGEVEKELVTPTGAALLKELCDVYGEPEGFISENVSYGAGTSDLESPNVLRALIGTLAPGGDGGLEVLEANIDDCNPQVFDYVMERLFKAGALDVWLTPVQMKKNRPAVKLSVLAPVCLRAEMENIIFFETTTIGVRRCKVERTIAERRIAKVRTSWGEVAVKISSVGGKTCSVTPEYGDCRALAGKNNVPLKKIMEAARAAAGIKEGK